MGKGSVYPGKTRCVRKYKLSLWLYSFRLLYSQWRYSQVIINNRNIFSFPGLTNQTLLQPKEAARTSGRGQLAPPRGHASRVTPAHPPGTMWLPHPNLTRLPTPDMRIRAQKYSVTNTVNGWRHFIAWTKLALQWRSSELKLNDGSHFTLISENERWIKNSILTRRHRIDIRRCWLIKQCMEK